MKTSLKLHRLQRGMKQSDLADLVNVRRETIGKAGTGAILSIIASGHGFGAGVRHHRRGPVQF